jgi:hypothetical protein
MQYLSQTAISPLLGPFKAYANLLEVIPGDVNISAISISSIDYSKQQLFKTC